MQREIRSTLILIVGILIPAETVHAWSSRASHTDNDLRSLSTAIRAYRMEFGKLPPLDRYWLELQRAGMWEPRQPGPPSDRWGRQLVYRAPGEHGDFDLYSYGEDGVDHSGTLDDISNWAGVNDGFYWKTNWPRGRNAIALGLVLGSTCFLLFSRIYPWWFVVPLAGSLICLGTLLGCHWLMHPGIVPSRNGPLALTSLVAAALLAVLILSLVVNIRNRGLT